MDSIEQVRNAVVFLAAIISVVCVLVACVRFFSLPSQRSRRLIVVAGAVGCVSSGLLAGWVSGLAVGWLVGLVGHGSDGFVIGILFFIKSKEALFHDSSQRSDSNHDMLTMELGKMRQALWVSLTAWVVSAFASLIWAPLAQGTELKLVALALPFFATACAMFVTAAYQHRGMAVMAVVFLLAIVVSGYIFYVEKPKPPTVDDARQRQERDRQRLLYQQAMSDNPTDRLTVATTLISNGQFEAMNRNAEPSEQNLVELLQGDTPATGEWRAQVASFNNVALVLTINEDGAFQLETVGAGRDIKPITGTVSARGPAITYTIGDTVISISYR